VNQFDSHPNERAHALAARAIDSFLTGQMTGAGAGTNPASSGNQTAGATAR
jgi:hypothetical protein